MKRVIAVCVYTLFAISLVSCAIQDTSATVYNQVPEATESNFLESFDVSKSSPPEGYLVSMNARNPADVAEKYIMSIATSKYECVRVLLGIKSNSVDEAEMERVLSESMYSSIYDYDGKSVYTSISRSELYVGSRESAVTVILSTIDGTEVGRFRVTLEKGEDGYWFVDDPELFSKIYED